jgi:transcriptional regulator with XRE-family HTH domain
MNCILESPLQMALNRFGEALRQLIGQRGMTQSDLAVQVGISETGLSLIINGVNKPRQKTFAKLMNRLARTPAERNFLMDAYLNLNSDEEQPASRDSYPSFEEPPAAPQHEEEDEPRTDTAARYLEAKAASLAFEQDVEHLLQMARVPCIHPFTTDKIACDFVTKTKNKVVIECKTNLNEGWDRLLGQCMLLRDNLPADAVVIVIPYQNRISELYASDFARQGFHVETPSSLIQRLKTLGVIAGK